jgi:protein gp37
MVKRLPHLHSEQVGPATFLHGFSRVLFHPSRLDQPLRWKKPRRIFVGSMTDIFHEDIGPDWLIEVFNRMLDASRHTFMILTKRPERMKRVVEMMADDDFLGTVLPNLWLGVTAENQEMADLRIPILLQTPAVKRFVSVEPMLGPVDLTPWIGPTLGCGSCGRTYSVAEAIPDPKGHSMGADKCVICGEEDYMLTLWGDRQVERFENGERYAEGTREVDEDGPQLHWCIAGGESGPGARPMHEEWPRDLVRQCRAAGVPVFVKQIHRLTPSGKIRVSKDVNEWPEDLRVREFPEVKG